MKNVIIALDVSNKTEAQNLISQLSPPISFYKVGLELYTAEGKSLIQSLKAHNLKVFLDLKLHDIPNTVARAVRVIAKLSPDFITVHALGGPKMLQAAVEASREANSEMKILAVTVLTSIDKKGLKQMGIEENIQDLVVGLGQVAYESGCDGLVCSAGDLPFLREKFPPDFLMVTPGIRLPQDYTDDQLRVATADEALKKGADYLVVGRSITEKKQPAEALRKLF